MSSRAKAGSRDGYSYGERNIKYVGGDPGDSDASRIPIVSNSQRPDKGKEFAGGNFYWMTLGDDRLNII